MPKSKDYIEFEKAVLSFLLVFPKQIIFSSGSKLEQKYAKVISMLGIKAAKLKYPIYRGLVIFLLSLVSIEAQPAVPPMPPPLILKHTFITTNFLIATNAITQYNFPMTNSLTEWFNIVSNTAYSIPIGNEIILHTNTTILGQIKKETKHVISLQTNTTIIETLSK